MAAGEQAAPRGAMGTAQRTLPQPTNAYAPPPQTMIPASAASETSASNGARSGPAAAPVDGGANAVGPHAERSSLAAFNPAAATPLADAPGATCAGTCGNTWILCKAPCKGESCRATCDEQCRGCMRACYCRARASPPARNLDARSGVG